MTVNSELASLHLSAGDELQESGNFDEAIAQYEKILALKIVGFKIPLN
jgi:tetratricopeptide (TPR) repeat protein